MKDTGFYQEKSKRGRKPKLPDEEWDKILKEIEGKVCLKEVTLR